MGTELSARSLTIVDGCDAYSYGQMVVKQVVKSAHCYRIGIVWLTPTMTKSTAFCVIVLISKNPRSPQLIGDMIEKGNEICRSKLTVIQFFKFHGGTPSL